MAKMVTRTYEGMNVEIMVFDIEKNGVDTMTIFTQKLTDEAKLEKAVRKALENNPVLKFIKVNKVTNVSELRGMEDSVFYANSVPLNPETRKPISEE